MDFSISDNMRRLLADLRKFLEREVYPLETALGCKSFRELIPELQQKREQVKQLGWWAPQIPREQGGMGLGVMDYALVSEELGRSPLGHYVFNCQAPDAGNMEVLMEFGTEQQKRQWLLPLVRGDIRSCFSMATEIS